MTQEIAINDLPAVLAFHDVDQVNAVLLDLLEPQVMVQHPQLPPVLYDPVPRLAIWHC